jgi:hypothetical protein
MTLRIEAMPRSGSAKRDRAQPFSRARRASAWRESQAAGWPRRRLRQTTTLRPPSEGKTQGLCSRALSRVTVRRPRLKAASTGATVRSAISGVSASSTTRSAGFPTATP